MEIKRKGTMLEGTKQKRKKKKNKRKESHDWQSGPKYGSDLT